MVDAGSDSVCLAAGVLLWRGGLSAGRLTQAIAATSVRIPATAPATFGVRSPCVDCELIVLHCSPFFTIWRSDRFWSGVWSDMTIEQVLMCAMKVSGGLTQGRGITESTLAKWVCALPLCTPLCTAVEEFAGSHTESSEQHSKASDHQDLRPAQQARDQADLEQFIQWLEPHPPFSGHYGGELVSLSTGVTGDSSVTCHNAKEVGQQLQKQMVGKSFADV